MSEAFVNRVTLDCLLNKKMFNNHIRNQKLKLVNKEDRRFYKKRIFNLFKEIITNNEPQDLPPDVKYCYDNFLHSAIHYFKTIDNNDLIQTEYSEYNISEDKALDSKMSCIDLSSESELSTNVEADKLLMRTIKADIPTLDKYVTRTIIKKKEEIIMPIQKEINLKDPNLKIKGIKKKNIHNLYEDNKEKNRVEVSDNQEKIE